MKVKFSRCQSSNLADVPKVDGQMIFTKDTGEAYLDVGENRSKISDIIFLQTIAERDSIISPLLNKLYYVLEDNQLYHYTGTTYQPVKIKAQETNFDNTDTTLESTNIQDAVTELDNKVGDISALLDKINGQGGNS